MYFRYFVIIPLGRRCGSLFEETCIPFTQGCFVSSLVEIGLVVLEKKIFKVHQCNFVISLYSPLGKERTFYLNKLESPSPRHAMCQVLLKLSQWFLRRRRKCEKCTTTTTTTTTTNNGEIVIRKKKFFLQSLSFIKIIIKVKSECFGENQSLSKIFRK